MRKAFKYSEKLFIQKPVCARKPAAGEVRIEREICIPLILLIFEEG